MKNQEVEAKFPLRNANVVLKNIDALNLHQIIKNQIQEDKYFTPCHKNFLEQEIVSEWFRVRKTNKKTTINFKQWLPIGAKIQNKCNEYELVVSSYKKINQILQLLDFNTLIVVKKTRNSWLFDETEISIDFVEGLGYYIEIESKKHLNDNEIENFHKLVEKILILLSAEVGIQDRRGYPYLILEKERLI